MSGNVRDGFRSARFSPGDGDWSVPSSVTSAATPNTRNSGPCVLVLDDQVDGRVARQSICSHR